MLTVVHGDFEWDADKAARNIAKHGVSFEEAALAMRDPCSQDFADGLQPANLVTLAATPFGRILYIVSTERDRRIRIISARDATRHERRRYEEAK
ncbi:MAG TPA: BrnT family toxin [Kofleriaceae bacterium]